MRSVRPQPRLDPRWVEARFDRIAGSYWLFERLFLVPRWARPHAVEMLQLQQGQRVLSIGCGQGPQLPALSRQVGINGRVVGVDLSQRMLAKARLRIAEHRLANVQLLHMDVRQYDAAPFDAILFGFSLTCSGDPAAVLRHAWELLAPGGRLVVQDAQLPAGLTRIAKPVMPMVRSFLESTVLGDPDMCPIEELRALGQPVVVERMRGAYFIASLCKPS